MFYNINIVRNNIFKVKELILDAKNKLKLTKKKLNCI